VTVSERQGLGHVAAAQGVDPVTVSERHGLGHVARRGATRSDYGDVSDRVPRPS
jgi:hypothetical protein